MNPAWELIKTLPESLRPLVAPGNIAHVNYLAPRLREADRLELTASSGEDILATITHCLQLSSMAWTFLNPVSMMPQTMAGLVLQPEGYGFPWAMGAPFDKAAARLFLAVSPLVIEYMRAQVTYLVNYVDARNTSAVRWLKWVGFTLGEARPWGLEQRDFIKFSMWGNKSNV